MVKKFLLGLFTCPQCGKLIGYDADKKEKIECNCGVIAYNNPALGEHGVDLAIDILNIFRGV